ncbi:unnamed protein product [Cladocopium goreaui]|uniref:DUF202 domain-containing protein n=1 Tax=Cladocopium goreaui TaxID=2562237 RepID=A0A9P1BS32_9DINO|nr:unnamed protein product [Cladocopium goreaui]
MLMLRVDVLTCYLRKKQTWRMSPAVCETGWVCHSTFNWSCRRRSACAGAGNSFDETSRRGGARPGQRRAQHRAGARTGADGMDKNEFGDDKNDATSLELAVFCFAFVPIAYDKRFKISYSMILSIALVVVATLALLVGWQRYHQVKQLGMLRARRIDVRPAFFCVILYVVLCCGCVVLKF